VQEDTEIFFMIIDLIDCVPPRRVNRKIYKVILDPNGKKIEAYIDKTRFEVIEYRKLFEITLKSEINDEDRQRLILENDHKRMIEKQKKKKISEEKEKANKLIAEKKEKDRKIKEDRLAKQRILDIRKKHPDWSDKTIQAISNKKVHIGMTKDQAIAAWGRPNDINKTITAVVTSEQWVYGQRSYLYFDNGVLTAIQN
jgi:hypothetical protein